MKRTCVIKIDTAQWKELEHLEIVQVIFLVLDRPEDGSCLCERGEEDDGLGVVVPQHRPECVLSLRCRVLSDHKLFHLHIIVSSPDKVDNF